jgi:hypothetical protein
MMFYHESISRIVSLLQTKKDKHIAFLDVRNIFESVIMKWKIFVTLSWDSSTTCPLEEKNLLAKRSGPLSMMTKKNS